MRRRWAPNVRDEEHRDLKGEPAQDDGDLGVPRDPRRRRLEGRREAAKVLELELEAALLFEQKALSLFEPMGATKRIHQSCPAARSASA